MRFIAVALVLLASVAAVPAAFAQAAQQAQLRLTVIDQTGASIPGAQIRLERAGSEPVTVVADRRGQVTVNALAVGQVTLHVEFGGFNPFGGDVTLRRGANNQTITLTVAGLQEEIVVNDIQSGDTRGNSQTTTLEEDEIAELSDDPDELRAQLEALTGGAGAVFQVNGFRGGRLPNRDEIRQIRFRTNSFSADNHDAGRVQVEIITRPGLTQWNGNANVGLRTDVLNARNAFAQAQTPEQFRRFTAGLRGPLVRSRTSLRFNVDGNRSFDSGTIVALAPEGPIADVVRRPFEQTNVTVGLEHAMTRNQSLRVEFRNSEDARRNLGVGDFNLAERAYTRASDEQQLRFSTQSIFGRSTLNEFRVQFNAQDSVSESFSSAPAIVVIDAFGRGGAGVSSNGTTKTLELADNFDFAVGRHAMRVGLLLETEIFTNTDARNAAGTFTFSTLEAFFAGTPATFTQRLGELRTSVSQYQLGMYWQDDVRLARSLSVSYGVRQEMQNHVGDTVNLMPRLGFTFNPSRTTTIRGGYGMFHDWYGSNLYDQTQRVTGGPGGQRDLLILNPGYPDPAGGVAAEVFGSGRVQADPALRLPYVHQASIGIERPLLPSLNFQASFMIIRGRSQLRSRNVNAPNGLGVRPEPDVGTVTQVESTGRSATDRLNVNLNYRLPGRRMFFNTNYTLSSVRNHADNATSLPANSLDPDAEWGPSSQDVRHRFNAMFNFGLPFNVRANIGGNASSAAPYNIVTGRDDNRDGVVNDRPAGVARNAGRGAARWEMNMRLTKAFGFGPPRGGQGGPEGGQGGGSNNQRFSMEVYAQAFNLMNRVNYGSFSGSMLSPFFGRPTSAGQARRVEVGLQFRF
ncbi:MAG: carboxypeptidase regulatory-like domain-containing protein [Acidimicrobiia bacterium]|nr:carboxypeptidase regulatory-like domain-containing protein [Acidimicrobiia bacterium]